MPPAQERKKKHGKMCIRDRAWSGCGIFCFADADYTWRLPYAERECGKYDNCVHSVFRRRDDRGNDFLGNDEKSCRKDLK